MKPYFIKAWVVCVTLVCAWLLYNGFAAPNAWLSLQNSTYVENHGNTVIVRFISSQNADFIAVPSVQGIRVGSRSQYTVTYVLSNLLEKQAHVWLRCSVQPVEVSEFLRSTFCSKTFFLEKSSSVEIPMVIHTGDALPYGIDAIYLQVHVGLDPIG